MKTPSLHLALLLCASAFLLGACAAPATRAMAEPPPAAGNPPADPAAESTLETLPTYLSLVQQMQGNGMWFASLAHIDAMEQKFGASPETRLLKADALRQTGQWPTSEALYLKLLDTPVRAAAYRGLGLLAGNQQHFPQAIEQLEKARQLRPTDGMLLNDLGYAHLMAVRFDGAQLPLMQATQLLPGNPKVAGNLALYFLVVGQADQARRVMDQGRFSAEARQAIEQLAQTLNPQSTPAMPAAQLRLKSALELGPVRVTQVTTEPSAESAR